MDCAEGQRLSLPRRLEAGRPDPYPQWRAGLARVVEQSFDGGCIDDATRRCRRTAAEILTSPYELLLNLVAQGLITEEEQSKVQHEFDRAGDLTVYGLMNAVTRLAHGHRGADRWRRALDLERLGGQIMRGDHQPPVLEPVFV